MRRQNDFGALIPVVLVAVLAMIGEYSAAMFALLAWLFLRARQEQIEQDEQDDEDSNTLLNINKGDFSFQVYGGGK